VEDVCQRVEIERRTGSMNILILNHYAGSPEMGMEFRPYYFAREWIKMGHRVDIMAADYSHLRRMNPEVDHDFQEQVVDGIHYHWIQTGTYEGNGAKRAMTMFRFVSKLWLNAKKIINELSPDVVIASSTYPLDTYVGQRIRKLSKKKVKLIHEVHDMWPATLIEIGGMSKRHPFVIAMQIGENSAYRNSDKVVSLPPLAKDYMIQHGLRPDKFVEIPNGVVVEDWERPLPLPKGHREVLTSLREDGKYIVGYFGGHALSNALEVLIDCAEQIKDDAVHFVLVGDGVEKPGLVSMVKMRDLKNVTFLDPIDKLAIPTLCEWFDVIYMGAKRSPLYRFGLAMNKMIDGMMAGTPMVCAITTPESPISKYNCGIMVDSMNVSGIIDAVLTIKNMEANAIGTMRENAKKVALSQYSYHILSKRFESIFV
jgi:glycosyltransferase involved in cell wall biosynthesis